MIHFKSDFLIHVSPSNNNIFIVRWNNFSGFLVPLPSETPSKVQDSHYLLGYFLLRFVGCTTFRLTVNS